MVAARPIDALRDPDNRTAVVKQKRLPLNPLGQVGVSVDFLRALFEQSDQLVGRNRQAIAGPSAGS
jgi:hypothetical protein